jgi:serine/threonine-protein kinase
MADWRLKSTLQQELDALLQVAAGVHHAHEYGVIHRDLKPANVMMRADGRAVVTDFGLAKAAGPENISLTPYGIMIGSPGYMSPEQARCLKTIDRRTDIYSLGVMLFQALTGRKPFEGRTVMEILLRMTRDPVPRPTECMRSGLNPLLYQELEKVCLKALQKNPFDRHPTAQAFAEDLSRARLGTTVAASLAS